MKYFNFLLATSLLLSFSQKSKQNGIKSPSVWNQYIGEDSTLHTYKFVEINGAQILQSITIRTQNPSQNGPKYIYHNYVEFNDSGLLKRIEILRSVSIQKSGNFQYDMDRVTYNNGDLNSIILNNENHNYLNLHRVNSFLVKSSTNKLDYPIYNFSNPNEVKINYIGKGVDRKLPVNDYKKKIEENVYRKYK
jgi:hypothetical protein